MEPLERGIFYILICFVVKWVNPHIQVHLAVHLNPYSLLHLSHTSITHTQTLTHPRPHFLRFYEANFNCYEHIWKKNIKTHSFGICTLKSFVLMDME